MNSICKKFKKVISSVVLSCSMVCSGGFANAGLNGRSISEADLDKIECLGNEWCDELKEKAKKYRRDQILSNTFRFIDNACVAAVYSIVSKNDNTAAGHIKRFIDNEISFKELVDTGSRLAQEGKICNFSLSCWMVRYLEERGIKCALTSVKKSFSGSKLDNIACFDRNWPNFGVIVFYNGKARIYIPDIMMTRNSASFENMCCKIDMSEHFCVFLGENDLKMLGLEGRKGRDFDLVTAKSWESAVKAYIMTNCNDVTAEFFEPIDDKLFNQLIPTSEKELISEKSGVFGEYFGFLSNFFSNNKKK